MKRFASLALALLAGCSAIGPNDFAGAAGANRTSQWYETGPVTKPREEIVKNVRDIVVRCGYPNPDIDTRTESFTTDWDVQMAPKWRESFRSRLEIEIVPLGNGSYNVRSRSWMEVNNNSVAPSDPNRAEWVGAGVTNRHADRIPEQALKFHTMLKFRLFGLNE
jgi:hypothetical protein